MGRDRSGGFQLAFEPLQVRQSLYFGYHRLRGSHVGRIYRDLSRGDHSLFSAGPDQIGLARIMTHAARNVPYYESLLAGREDEIAEDPVSVLRSLPLLKREIVRDRFPELQARDADAARCREQTSGGSTGEPVRLVQDGRFRDFELAANMLQAGWTGWRFGEPEVWIWGSERDILDGHGRLVERLGSRLTGRRYVNAFRLTPELMRECLAQLDAEPPRLIVAYAHTLDDLAAFAEEEGIQVAPQRAIISTASTLHAPMRERIERVFGTRLFDQYGSREVGDIACECESHRGLHVLPWMSFVEVVDEDDQPIHDGGEGRVVVTSLRNFAMPLIRYEVGDRARFVDPTEPPCPCGRQGPRLAQVTGRTGDTFKAADGTHVASGYFIHLLFFRDFVRRFQVVQTAPDRVLYKLIVKSQPQAAALEEIAHDTRAVMGDGCAVDFEFPLELPVSPSGKYRYTISEC